MTDGPEIDRAAIDARVLWTVVRTAHRVERRLTADLTEVALSPIQFGVLCQLAIETSMTNARLARLCIVRPQTMAGVVDGMASRGLVRREGPGGRGRPAQIVSTTEGEALFARAWPIFLAADAAVTQELTGDEAARLNEVLHRVEPHEETGS